MSHQSSRRLLSLDVFRGLTIAGMILVNSPGNRTAYAPLEHAEWNGWTPTDLVFPFFIFILGVSVVLSSRKTFRQILKRSAIIFGIGLLLNGFPYNHLDVIRIPGVLQRIALCYFFASLLYVRLPAKSLMAVTAGLLVSYWFLIKGDLTPAGNLGAVIDRMIFHGHMYTPEFDPEGLLSTLPAIATALIGVLTGEFLVRPDEKPTNKACGLFAAGVIGVLLGQIWNIWFPINKALWTSSYVLFTAGLGLILLSGLYWLIEIKNIKTGWTFFVVYGVNGLLAYALPLFFLKTLNRIDAPNADGTVGNLRLFFTRHVFESWTTPMNASLLFALSHVLLWYFVFSALYKRNIVVKI